jgi:tripartite motif-containing protein 71
VADQYSFSVQKFARDGTFVREWGGYGSGEGRFGRTGGSATATTGTVGGIGGLAVDRRGNVFVLDSFNPRVQQFAADGTFKRTIGSFGSGPGEFDPGINGGVAVFGDYLYVADQDNNRIERFHLGDDGAPDGEPLIFGSAGSGPGQFNLPTGIAVDPEGDHDVFVADDRNHRVQRFSADGIFEQATGSFGTGPGQFRFPYDVSVDHFDRLFVADNNHRVQRFQASTLAFQDLWGSFGNLPEQMGFPRSLAALAATDDGGVYVGDTSNDEIDEWTAAGDFRRTWGASGRAAGNFTIPRGVAIGRQSVLLVADTRNDRIERFRPNRRFLDAWGALNSLGYPASGSDPGEFADPSGVAVDPASGDVYVTEGGNHRVQRLAADGTAIETYGGLRAGTGLGQFKEPLGVAVGPGGELLVADTRNDRLQRRDPVTGAWSLIPGSFARPAAIAVDAAGRIYVAEAAADRVQVLAPDGSAEAVIGGLAAPEGVTIDRDGALIVADTGDSRVLRYVRGADGWTLEAQLGGPGTQPGRFILPIGVAVDEDGSLYVADAYNNRIQKFPAQEG